MKNNEPARLPDEVLVSHFDEKDEKQQEEILDFLHYLQDKQR